MFQPIESSSLTTDRKPERDTIIEKDEIISLKIDLEVLSPEEFLKKYLKAE